MARWHSVLLTETAMDARPKLNSMLGHEAGRPGGTTATDHGAVLDALLDALADRLADRLASRLAAPSFASMPAANEPQQEQGVSISDAAGVLGVSERTVASGVADESIPSLKVRGRRVVLLAKYLAQNSDEEVARRAREVLRRSA